MIGPFLVMIWYHYISGWFVLLSERGKKSAKTCPMGETNVTILFWLGLVFGFWWVYDQFYLPQY
jgi:hypothetical protein